jgi:hypothetical protein
MTTNHSAQSGVTTAQQNEARQDRRQEAIRRDTISTIRETRRI